MKKNFAIRLLPLALAILLSAASLFAAAPAGGEKTPEPREIIRKMEENMRGRSAYQVMTMVTVRPRYTREISLRSWTLGEDYALVRVTAPARDEGTAFLKRGSETWNYQPTIERTVRMPPSMMSQSWMGSDFTNDDLVRAVSLADDYTHDLVGTDTAGGWECDVIDLTPKPDNPVVYEKTRYWVTREYRLPARVENYDERDELVNTLHVREIREMGGRFVPAVMEMLPAGKENRKTVIRVREAEFDIEIGEEFFSLRNLADDRRRRQPAR